MESILAITRALSDENRVRALLALGDQEVCVCQLIELLQLAPSTVSTYVGSEAGWARCWPEERALDVVPIARDSGFARIRQALSGSGGSVKAPAFGWIQGAWKNSDDEPRHAL
jgi:DNA-binding transcriptional ArsR family regulator